MLRDSPRGRAQKCLSPHFLCLKFEAWLAFSVSPMPVLEIWGMACVLGVHLTVWDIYEMYTSDEVGASFTVHIERHMPCPINTSYFKRKGGAVYNLKNLIS